MLTATEFVFESYSFDSRVGLFVCTYKNIFLDGTFQTHTSTLNISSYVTEENWNTVPQLLRESLLQSLHLMFGIVYWKMYCARTISIIPYTLTLEQKVFWDMVYTKGLGEFFYTNKIDFRGLIDFPYDQSKVLQGSMYPRKERSLVGIGGGKDSIVASEMLTDEHKNFDVFILNKTPIQIVTADTLGKKPYCVQWRIDQNCFDSVRNKTAYHGHIPYTAVYSFVGILLAVVLDYKYVVLANEKSADEGNVLYMGADINHQWSKSLEFEVAFKEYVHTLITPDVVPYSILRPYYEIEIVKKFSLMPEYFNHFSSCNSNFSSGKTHVEGEPYWCKKCPKCVFVFVCLTAFLSKDTVVSILGSNLYDHVELLPIFTALLGIESNKPFECVGTKEEVMVAMKRARQSGEYSDSPILLLTEKYLHEKGEAMTLLESKIA